MEHFAGLDVSVKDTNRTCTHFFGMLSTRHARNLSLMLDAFSAFSKLWPIIALAGTLPR